MDIRGWDNTNQTMIYPTQSKTAGWIVDNIPSPHIMRFTGWEDFNKKPIYEGDYLRCLYRIGTDKEKYFTDSIYETHISIKTGMYLRYVRLYNPKFDLPTSQYPINQELSFHNNILSYNSVDQKYTQLAIKDSYNTWGDRRRQESHFSKYIEIIGNKYETTL